MKNFKDKVVYQIYPKSFSDTNGDGVGDIRGIIEKIDYLSLLGVDYLWVTPFFVSPLKDNGYDVQDYYNIDPSFGMMSDLEELIQKAESKNIGIMLDMVFNHTSTDHEWFRKALAGDKKYKDYYIFKKGKPNSEPPTNWVSKFGGSTWEYVEELDEYYLHLFDVSQADLNWRNEDVRKECVSILNFWINKGIKGFRFDVINLISKPENYDDDYVGDGRRFYTDGPDVVNYLQYMNQEAFGGKDILTVGEMSSTTLEKCEDYSGKNQNTLSMTFNFHHLKVDYVDGEKWSSDGFEMKDLRQIMNEWQVGMDSGWSALFLNCHDQPRSVSRFGNDVEYHNESAKLLATLVHMQRGTPYIYQGEEIGMTNADFNDISQYRDVESLNAFKNLNNRGFNDKEVIEILKSKSRDNARTPMQWDRKGGFTSAQEPWIEINPNTREINAENEITDPNSVFNFYRKLIKLRKSKMCISEGAFIPMFENNEYLYAFKRVYESEEVIVLLNFGGQNLDFEISELNHYKLLLGNYGKPIINDTRISFRPYESIILEKC